MNKTRVYGGLTVCAFILFSYAFYVNAWVVDDAYITFRTVDNFVEGYGLTWNVAERVQVYSHPLWMFLMSAAYFFSREAYYTSLVVSYSLCLVSFVLILVLFNKEDGGLWKAPFLVAMLMACKAYVDYTSSGLENPLSYLLIAAFYFRFLDWSGTGREYGEKDLMYLFGIASLAFVNRQDCVLLYAPALCYLIAVCARRLRGRLAMVVIVATLPASLWLLFSLFYYGFLFPNTAYAKLSNTGVPFADRAWRGVEYFQNSWDWDWFSYAVLATAIVMTLYRKSTGALLGICGVALYLLYILLAAASATHMAGRFLSVPFFLVFVLFSYLLKTKKAAGLWVVVAAVYLVWSPISSLKMATDYYKVPEQPPSAIDTKWYVYNQGAALLSPETDGPLPDNAWYHAGERFREHPATVHVGGPKGGQPIGFFGYAAGPDKFIIDYLGLGDPLLARLKAKNTTKRERWSSGHFFRLIPAGYAESIKESKNLIRDPDLHKYYDKVLLITRGPLFSMERLGAIAGMNLGLYQGWVDAYELKPHEDYRAVIKRWRGPVL